MVTVCNLNLFRRGLDGSRDTFGVELPLHGPKTMLLADFIFQKMNSVVKALDGIQSDQMQRQIGHESYLP